MKTFVFCMFFNYVYRPSIIIFNYEYKKKRNGYIIAGHSSHMCVCVCVCVYIYLSSSSSYASTAQYGPWPPLLVFRNNNLLQGWIVSPAPNPQTPTWRTRPPDLWPPETGWPSYTPRLCIYIYIYIYIFIFVCVCVCVCVCARAHTHTQIYI
jgi:hypothetical protein